MKKQTIFTAMILLMTLTQSGMAESTKNLFQSGLIKQVNVINNSEVSIRPTGEGYTQGCIGGNIPPVFDPIKPHQSRTINVVFVNYLPSCEFTVLPLPNVLSSLQACHGVKADDTIVYTGDNFKNMRCTIVS